MNRGREAGGCVPVWVWACGRGSVRLSPGCPTAPWDALHRILSLYTACSPQAPLRLTVCPPDTVCIGGDFNGFGILSDTRDEPVPGQEPGKDLSRPGKQLLAARHFLIPSTNWEELREEYAHTHKKKNVKLSNPLTGSEVLDF